MPLTDRARLEDEARHPLIVELWRALQPLQTVVSFMNTGAHPDDETSALLAALAWRDGIDISCACATRGEGGQNDIGTESGAALGVLRTAEMEAACDVLGLRMYWLSEGPGDAIFDFGFSKSGKETLGRWGKDRTLARFVHILRRERPDIICPTFLDVPGQHGHHRAMTEAAHLVMDLAADPAFPGTDLPPWQVKKLFLPAWSGAGQAYDDDLPPPTATLTVPGAGRDPVTGWSFERIGQQSRACHATQAMGKWVPAGTERDWPLHLADDRVDGAGASLSSGLAVKLTDLKDCPHLAEAQARMDAARTAFPDAEAILAEASAALAALRRGTGALTDPQRAAFGHKLTRKAQQLSQLIRLAAGVDVHAVADRDFARPGDAVRVTLETRSGRAEALSVEPILPHGWIADTRGDAITLSVGDTARPGDPYPDSYLPGAPPAPAVSVRITARGQTSETVLPLRPAPVVLPARSAAPSPAAAVLNTATDTRTLALTLTDVAPAGAEPALTLPEGWQAERTETGFRVTAPAVLPEGAYRLTLTLDGQPAQSVRRIAHGHVAPRALATPAVVTVRAVNVALPDARIGYIGGGNDRVDHWLAAIGVDVTALTDAELASEGALAGYDTLLVGIFAMRFRAGLAQAMPRINDWVRAGGTLVTLYHRPWDAWDPDTIPPARLEIGQPSLRWRVTDENARVTVLADHPALNTPNRIGPDDWANWHKERGLYFAKDWDPAYTALLSMHDDGEAPLTGALLAAEIGRGRHIHTALILHHQMERLTPGAFRLMANLVTPRDD
ncbi:PIG-L family deacetylase [Rhodobacteraceae bacterium 2CG4]|uniref:PIG-L family deacetylase n=1 Tax=Halovulum marinum TaxID=2662447 RepID=A0A6L5YY24_9RHOB|nr:PIG-L family deacetylase [Halovulum marinum]MSU88840.1 PIG-L family deacetylase [Halovulum marinum]